MSDSGKVDFEKLKETVKVAVRMGDNVIDTTPYFLEENENMAKGERRIGLGVMGLSDLLIKCEVRYGSKQANEIVNDVFSTIATTAYRASIDLAKEKGSFPFLKDGDGTVQKRVKFINSGYMKNMPEDIREGVLECGIRNSHLLTVAPTGSTGTMAGVSTGLEPYFAFKYYRSGRLGKYIPVVSDIALEWLDNNGFDHENGDIDELIKELPNHFVTAMELTPEDHVEVQCLIQRWIDSSISKTVNAPKGYTVEQVKDVYERLHKGGAKGGTVYVDGSRDAQVLSLSNENEEKQDNKIMIVETIKPLKETKTDFGNEVGNTCPNCRIGKVVDRGGCTECDNCGIQLKCGL